MGTTGATVTVNDESGGLNAATLGAIVSIGSILACLCLVWVIINVIASKCPDSKLGKKFNDWKAKRAMNSEQKHLQKMENLRKQAGILGQRDMRAAIANQANSGGRKKADDLRRAAEMHRVPGKVYPNTDIDDGNISAANVKPGGFTSDEQYNGEGDEKWGKKQASNRSKIQVVGYDSKGNPVGNAPGNNAD